MSEIWDTLMYSNFFKSLENISYVKSSVRHNCKVGQWSGKNQCLQFKYDLSMYSIFCFLKDILHTNFGQIFIQMH